MRTIAVIPARYNSSRFPGKPLADILGKPMIWWVYQQVSKVKQFSDIVVATDDDRIRNYCETNDMKVLMTSQEHENHIFRVHEVSTKVEADYYVCVNGDEPMIEAHVIQAIFQPIDNREDFLVANLMTSITDPTQAVDFSKIKIIADDKGYGMYMSRSPIPYPRGDSKYDFKKYVGVECFTKESLEFFVNTPMSRLEKIEDIDHLRFLENGIRIRFVDVASDNLSVDTPKDLEKVKQLLSNRLK